MHLRTLELFCTIADQRSFSRAAAAHGLTQGAASQSIAQLEECLEVTLIDRSKRPLLLTAEGLAYLRGVRGILRSYQRLEDEVRSIRKRLSGQVTIGSIVSVGLSYMPEATEVFARLHPGVDVRSQFGPVDRVIEMVTEGEVDFGLVSYPRNSKSIQCIDWQLEPVKLVCSDKHPLADCREVRLSQLSGMEMIGFDRRLLLRQEIDRFMSEAGVEVDVRMEFDNADSMIRAIQANRGIGVLPEAAVRRETATGSLRVVPCRELRMTRPLGIIFRRSGRLSEVASEFASLLLGRPITSESKQKSGNKKQHSDPPANSAGGSPDPKQASVIA
ncbi:LysR family transcriptional regulator [Rubripirellula amarantea]|uniref:HTH-type transcriptional activator CmpR n=1 Tax=Rubripirellula amarantea TaxID=2527999 RepID=A0A5C5WPX1_9BACT|nr:LysR family transcriptional regulator [Rubripirellula amarantea]MDA8746407.1 LysR family transcriptional regulator [Rubripirellula amarantea]TWT52617.1 HTH-type transcriptional activator CmpR [Rubripirellula amarantea]